MGKSTLPFTISKQENFFERLGEYVGDVFYDILPEQGYELRDEQIYMAFQLEQAFKHKRIMFAEAGVGTGKTFVYLLYAICYARYKGRPAIISCADETLIEQLVKKGGDIEKLEKALGLKVDVRLAKSREQYVCVRKLDAIVQDTDDEDILHVYKKIPEYVFHANPKMQSFEKYGDRKEYPWVPNEKWEKIAWDSLQQCSTCEFRHRSGQTLNREYYRHATDIIICSHDFYMEHIWTKESRKREGQMPLLPEASAVIFDEGHLLELAAQKGLTYRYNLAMLETVLTTYVGQEVRETSLHLIEDILRIHDAFFQDLTNAGQSIEGSNRKEMVMNDKLLQRAKLLNKRVQQLLEEFVFDSELFTMDDYHLKIVEEYLEFFSKGLSILLKKDEGIYWLEENDGESSLVLMPRLVEHVLKKEVFSKDIPFIFSSATLSQNGDFSYLANSLGIENYDFFSVKSPFNYRKKMKVFGSIDRNQTEKLGNIQQMLLENEGRTLLLFSSKEEMEEFREWAYAYNWPFLIYYEGDREISETVREFQRDITSVLCSYHLWEGLDIPGDALTQVIIYSLPFPPKDPVFKAKHKHAKDPVEEVDIPYMLLRLEQGVGRLIRTREDEGKVHIWTTKEEKIQYRKWIENILPTKIEWQ